MPFLVFWKLIQPPQRLPLACFVASLSRHLRHQLLRCYSLRSFGDSFKNNQISSSTSTCGKHIRAKASKYHFWAFSSSIIRCTKDQKEEQLHNNSLYNCIFDTVWPSGLRRRALWKMCTLFSSLRRIRFEQRNHINIEKFQSDASVCKSKCKGFAQIWAAIAGFKVQNANRYTTRPWWILKLLLAHRIVLSYLLHFFESENKFEICHTIFDVNTKIAQVKRRRLTGFLKHHETRKQSHGISRKRNIDRGPYADNLIVYPTSATWLIRVVRWPAQDSNLESPALEADALSIRPTGRCGYCRAAFRYVI